jgi:hypothetical protein
MAEYKVEKSNVLMLIQKAMLSRTYNPPQIFDFYMTAKQVCIGIMLRCCRCHQSVDGMIVVVVSL